jgi:hypothetical protein
VQIARVQLGSAAIRIQSVVGLVVTRLVLRMISFPFLLEREREREREREKNGRLTKVPRSYHTSEMYGFRRIAREYASRASRYWLI